MWCAERSDQECGTASGRGVNGVRQNVIGGTGHIGNQIDVSKEKEEVKVNRNKACRLRESH